MGSLCCCPCGDEFEEYAYPSNSINRHCICLRFFFHQLFSGVPYGSLSRRLEGPTLSPVQGTATLSSSGIGTALPDSSSNVTFHPFSRQLPHDSDQRFAYSSLNDSYHPVSRQSSYDADQRYSHLQRDGLVSRRDKSMTHLQEDLQPLRRNTTSSVVESLGSVKQWGGAESEEGCKVAHLESSENILDMKAAYGMICVQPSSEDEDVCPTCLDEYTLENPKITTRCSHHFHLGCIYEWMERSESCPICGKEMEFCESP